METARIDPRVRQAFASRLLNLLYEKVTESFDSRLDAIVTKNMELNQTGWAYFRYRGKFYHMTTHNHHPSFPQMTLNPQLAPYMDKWIEEHTAVMDFERAYSKGAITNLLASASYPYDWLKLFPESMHQPIQKDIEQIGAGFGVPLTEDQLQAIKDRNKVGISKMKQRMLLNLLL